MLESKIEKGIYVYIRETGRKTIISFFPPTKKPRMQAIYLAVCMHNSKKPRIHSVCRSRRNENTSAFSSFQRWPYTKKSFLQIFRLGQGEKKKKRSAIDSPIFCLSGSRGRRDMRKRNEYYCSLFFRVSVFSFQVLKDKGNSV